MLLLNVSQKIFDVLPIVFIGGVRKYFILRRAVGHCLFFAFAECQHPCQLVIGLLMQILGICFVSASHSGLLSVYFLNLFFTLQSSSARLFRLLKPGAASCQLHLESRQSAIHFFYLLMCAVYRNRSPTLFLPAYVCSPFSFPRQLGSVGAFAEGASLREIYSIPAAIT